MPHATRIGLVLLLHAAMAPLLPSIDAFSSSSSSPISVGRAVRRRRRSTPGDAHMPRYRALTNSICTFHNHSVASSSSSSTSSLLSGNRVARLSDEDDPDDDVHPPSIGLEGSLSAIETGPVEDAPPAPANDDPTDVLSTYVGPRFILGLVAMLYGTNFPLGAIMNDNLPASASTSSRMVLASFVLSPFLFRLRPNLIRRVLLGGSFVSLGYISQSLALVDTSPALVSFLGSATVLVCPILGWLVDGRRMGIRDAPQTWLAASLCLSGVAALELFDSNTNALSLALLSKLGTGDALSLVQAIGFGTGVFLSEKMMKEEPDQALPITAGLVSTTALYAMMWCLADGWMDRPGWESMGLPGLFMDENMRTVALAVLWTGVVSTSMNFCIEITALGRVPSSEASVILATEPLWASLFAALLFHEQFGISDYVGGALMISACLVNTLRPSDITGFFFAKDTVESDE